MFHQFIYDQNERPHRLNFAWERSYSNMICLQRDFVTKECKNKVRVDNLCAVGRDKYGPTSYSDEEKVLQVCVDDIH